jgi:hypothetical protein
MPVVTAVAVVEQATKKERPEGRSFRSGKPRGISRITLPD